MLAPGGGWTSRASLLDAQRACRQRIADGFMLCGGRWVPAWRVDGPVQYPAMHIRMQKEHTSEPEDNPLHGMTSDACRCSDGKDQGDDPIRIAEPETIDAELVVDSLAIARMRISGYIDKRHEANAARALRRLAEAGARAVVISVSDTVYLSSAVWSVLAGYASSFRQRGGGCAVTGISARIRQGYSLMRLETVLPAFDTEQQARAYVTGELIRFDRDATNSVRGESPSVDYATLPMDERIRKAIADYGGLSFHALRKRLGEGRYGGKAPSVIRLFWLLREMNLDTRKKRFRYFRSA